MLSSVLKTALKDEWFFILSFKMKNQSLSPVTELISANNFKQNLMRSVIPPNLDGCSVELSMVQIRLLFR